MVTKPNPPDKPARPRIWNGPTIDPATDSWLELLKTLNGDVVRAQEVWQRDIHSQFAMRQFVRATLAMQEGMTYAIKQLALAAHKDGLYTFSEGTLAVLRETSYSVNERGIVKARPAFITARANFRFAMTVCATALCPGFALQLNAAGWADFQQAIRIRDRLTHPKSVADLQVSLQDFKTVVSGNGWFVDQMLGFLEESFLRTGMTREEMEILVANTRRRMQETADLAQQPLGKDE